MMDEAQTETALSIGVVLGGSPEVDDVWRPQLQTLMKSVMVHRMGLMSPLSVNVVFHVEGRLLPALDYEGVRTGRFSRKTSELMVQAAVPQGPCDDEREVLLQLLHEAVVKAEEFTRRRQIAASLPELHDIVDAVRREMQAQEPG